MYAATHYFKIEGKQAALERKINFIALPTQCCSNVSYLTIKIAITVLVLSNNRSATYLNNSYYLIDTSSA